MQTSMAVLIAVIVILITGLIVLTIFGGTIGKVFPPELTDPCANACTAYQQICTESREYAQLAGCVNPKPELGTTCPCTRAG